MTSTFTWIQQELLEVFFSGLQYSSGWLELLYATFVQFLSFFVDLLDSKAPRAIIFILAFFKINDISALNIFRSLFIFLSHQSERK